MTLKEWAKDELFRAESVIKKVGLGFPIGDIEFMVARNTKSLMTTVLAKIEEDASVQTSSKE